METIALDKLMQARETARQRLVQSEPAKALDWKALIEKKKKEYAGENGIPETVKKINDSPMNNFYSKKEVFQKTSDMVKNESNGIPQKKLGTLLDLRI